VRLKTTLMGLLLAIALVLGVGPRADAGPERASHPPTEDHNLCVWFRPYSSGTMYFHFRFTGDVNLVCQVRYSNGTCYQYYVRWFGGWNGPYDVSRVSCP
jgi:hypothetical protein